MAVYDKHELHVAQTPLCGPSGLRRCPRSTMLHDHELLAVTNITALSSEFSILRSALSGYKSPSFNRELPDQHTPDRLAISNVLLLQDARCEGALVVRAGHGDV